MSLFFAFNRQCKITPNNIAIVENEWQLTYQQLLHSLDPLTASIRSHSSQCERIAIALDRGINATRAILSILQINACYIPLDLKNPKDRLDYIVNDADVQCVIGKGDCPEWLTNSQIWLDIDNLPETPNISNDLSKQTQTSLATILYTSGSTGTPKGVAHTHSAISNFINWGISTFNINETDRIASLTPFHFDLSLFDIFCSLSCGASIHFIPSMYTMAPSRLSNWLSENKITTWYTVPSILNFMSLKGSLKTTPLPHLKTLLFAGEVFPTPQLIKLCELLPDVNLYNLYGPTETNVCCYWPVDRNRLNKSQAIPIGLPACNSTLSISYENNELLVQSKNNLAGYWQKGKLIPALLENNHYPTGDKVSLNEYKEYCFHGRLDRMLKCSGYRVEPAEIEQVILQDDMVDNCAVFGIKDISSGQRPVAVIVLKKGGDLTDIVKNIKQKLPIYMHPCKFKTLDSLPYLSNGKADLLILQQQMEEL